MLFREGDTDLHRTAGMHRIQRAKQLLPHRHHIDEIIENGAELFLGFHRIQPFAVAFTVWRGDFKGGMHQENRDMHRLGPAVNLLPGDFVQARHDRIGLIHRFLLRHRQHRADILLSGRDFLTFEGCGQRISPRTAILHAGGHFLPHHARHINGLLPFFERGGPFFGTARQHEGGK